MLACAAPLGYRGRRDNYRGPPRGGGPASASSQNPVYRYDSEFDFESANARFNKDDLEEEFKQKLKVVEGEEKVSNGNGTAEGMDEVGVEEIPADGGSEGEFYDKSKSFFDSISCESNKQSGAGRYVSPCVCVYDMRSLVPIHTCTSMCPSVQCVCAHRPGHTLRMSLEI